MPPVQNNKGGAAVSVVATTTSATPVITPPPVTQAPLAGKPDLTVTSVSFSPASGKAGQNLSVTLTIKNQGSAASGNFSNRISLASSRYGTNYSLGNFAMNSLAASASFTFTITSNAIPSSAPAGSYWVTVFTDGLQQIAETDENNNIGSSDPARFTLPAEAAAVSATITSATATVKMETKGVSSYGTLTVIASGTASGPVGAMLAFRYHLISPKYGRIYQNTAHKSTGGWTVITTYGTLERKAGEPESITWTYTGSGINMATDAYPGVDTELTVSIRVPNSYDYDPPVTKTMRIKAN